MGDVTPLLKLNVPVFDQDPWDQEVNDNWATLDAAVGMFTMIPNLVGVWKNATAYTYGQTTIDPADSSMWSCAQAHTSSPTPLSFANERITYPARWAMLQSGAQYYAQQAYNSSQAAAASAAAAAASAATIGNALPISGGTMTGFIVLHHDPTAAMHPATKQYVDARVGGVGFLPITGGTLTGALTIGGNGALYSVITTANRRAIAFGYDGVGLYPEVDGVNLGYLATQGYVSGNFLPLTGGSISGAVTVGGTLQTLNTFILSSTLTYLQSTPSVVDLQMDSGGWRLRYNRSTGALAYLRGSDGAQLFGIDGTGNVNALGSISGTYGAFSGNMFIRGGALYVGAADRSRFISDNATFTALNLLDAYGWQLTWSSGVVTWTRYDGAGMFTIDPSGNVRAAGNVRAGAALSCCGDDMWMGNGASGREFTMSSGWFWDWNSSNGDLWWRYTSSFWAMAASISTCFNNLGPTGGVGAYINYSDIRGKRDIEPLPLGLDAVLKLEPIIFTRITNDKREIGFSAQDVAKIIPEAVRDFGILLPDGSGGIESDEPTLGMFIDPIVAAMVNGMKELTTRIIALESKQ